ncbi:cell division protein ZipA C-terminal FtsZ-binding domain-containing protein [uncultured Propionivibrio sp.]|uniref:cell division protein ZipA C-terminal FtsZ-binding domain-containing protein n=1 Tax=uncultured Propionivibrio sp. TaxID=426737 RepID=UPI0029C05C16|nr:cell division protein ZipA C-terminal FtsZ-binding domain-containing protein [uncultured Propionivibrio sp.]
MTELQMGLIGLGVVAVSGVVAYNAWVEYRHRSLAQRLLEPTQDDVLVTMSDEDESPMASVEQASEPEDAPSSDASALMAEDDDLPAPVPEAPVIENRTPSGPVPQRIEPVLRVDAVDDERIEPVLRVEDDVIASPTPAPVTAPAPASVSEPVAPTRPAAPVQAAVAPKPAVAPRPPVTATPMPEPKPTPRRAEPVDVPVEVPAAGEEFREVAEPLHLLSAEVDYIAALEAIEPAPAAQILGAVKEALAHVRKRVVWLGFNEMTREWEAIEAGSGTPYRSLRIGLQLVDRRGPVSDAELTVFHVAMHDLAHALMAIVDMPQRQGALEKAATLDAFCAGVDIQIGINVVSVAAPLPGTKIRALAESAGMVIENGRFVRADDDGNILYVLLNQEAVGFAGEAMKTMTTHGLTFLLDVPTVAHGDRIFAQMVDLAKRFADVLKGALVDDNRRPLSDGALDPIRRQISQYQTTMATRKLPAGGAFAQRLFS